MDKSDGSIGAGIQTATDALCLRECVKPRSGQECGILLRCWLVESDQRNLRAL
jgi:hypothetical protein